MTQVMQREFKTPEIKRLRNKFYTTRWRANNPELSRRLGRESHRRIMSKPEGRVKHLLSQAKRRARKSGVEFSIALADLLPLPIRCPVLGIEINYKGTGGYGFDPLSASLDRIDAKAGYTKGNVVVISWRANRLKSDATVDELKMLVSYMDRHAAFK